MTWANRITIFRILLIPVFIALLVYYHAGQREGGADERLRWAALAVFAVAAILDGVDGFIARHFNQRSRLGAVLDPLADKLLLMAALILLSFIRFRQGPLLPLWFPIIVLSRDALVILGCAVLYGLARHVDVRPHGIGKAATVFQLVAVGLVLAGWPGVREVCGAGGVCTLASLWIYGGEMIRRIQLSGYGEASGVVRKKPGL